MERLKFKIFGGKVRAAVLDDLNVEAQFMHQVHGDRIAVIDKLGEIPECDALISCANLTLAVKTADCIPLVIADEDVGIVAAVHAGWRGLVADIIPKTIAKMLEMGALAERIKVGIGPSLGFSCAEFSDPLNEIPEKYHYGIHGRNVDLNEIALRQLEEAGVSQIEHFDICTKCDASWPSFRRDGTKERFATIISLHE